ncbi:MAG: single-stranded-DNA-specific exonuclease RecJ [Lachnospiraceae bacterium]|nr:single-stranded-DNA-specific exonuclease RecJ [uncultured Acetatifactor sp.]MCI8542699.1 single-stranded-DNA-specific exonuclease RecJ [Lachnospiraceae bacterium]
MEKWYVAAKKADFNEWAEEFHISPVVARVLRNRDLTEKDQVRRFLYGKLEDCYSPWLLKDMDRAVEHILAAIDEGIRIRVIGDYDVDGVCASYILTKGLGILGAKVDTAIPHRIHDGYGLNDNLIEIARQDGIGMIVTCDNGIAAAPQIALANSYGIRVIVTDHHEVPFVTEQDGVRREQLPPALAVIDPKQEQCRYPFPGICGGTVAYKLIAALAEKTGDGNLREAMEELLEFVALSTVCDVMELKNENRILVKEGLRRLKNTRNQGLKALIEVNGIEPERLSAYHLGFVIGPCLNATGRLDTAKRALELLQSATKTEAMSAARELKELNDSRKNLTLQGVEQAESYLREHHMEQDKVLVIFLPEVHESLAGIIAGRIREKYCHPVFILTRGEEGVKGSGRSVEGYHMYEAMTQVKQYFTKFGGHAMAAGLSMKEGDIGDFRRDLNANCRLGPEDFIPKVHIDVPMPLEYADGKIADELELLEPFGVGNPKPLFAQKNLRFLSGYKMGANKTCARYRVQTESGAQKQLVFFGNLERFAAFLEEKYGPGSEAALYEGRGDFSLSVVYQLGKNTYRGKTEIQYVMQYYS